MQPQLIPKKVLNVPYFIDVGNLVAHMVCHSKKCILFKRQSPNGVILSYDVFKFDDDTVSDGGEIVYPTIDMFASGFHTAKRLYCVSYYKNRATEHISVPTHRAFVRGMEILKDYNK